jgi:pyruvate/2-oxoglutarate dehydrogenase complex dihydrolipoamide acyltransferase (E2) component
MATTLRVPKLGVSMEEGTLVAWLVADGATVAAGAALYRIETDKVESDVEAPVAGVLRQQAPAGGTYPVGTPVGVIE